MYPPSFRVGSSNALPSSARSPNDRALCDEPTYALDSKTGIRAIDALLGVNRELGTTTVIIAYNATVLRPLSAVEFSAIVTRKFRAGCGLRDRKGEGVSSRHRCRTRPCQRRYSVREAVKGAGLTKAWTLQSGPETADFKNSLGPAANYVLWYALWSPAIPYNTPCSAMSTVT